MPHTPTIPDAKPALLIMTDQPADRYWTVVAEMEVASVQAFEDRMTNASSTPEDLKTFENIMKGHDLVDRGKRETSVDDEPSWGVRANDGRRT